MNLPATDELIRIAGAVAVTVAVVGLAAMFFMWVFDEHEAGIARFGTILLFVNSVSL
jgi:hypothetical protein